MPTRLIKITVVAVAISLVVGGFIWWRIRRKPVETLVSHMNRFEIWHAEREAKNPPGLVMTLDTADGKRTYSESEYIPLVIKYSSTIFRKYNIETASGSSAVGQSQRLHAADGIRSLSQLGGFACCGSLPRILESTPYVFTPPMRLRLMPGKHELYITANQVFAREPGVKIESGETSSILWLDIASDPGWQQRELAKIHGEYGSDERVQYSNCRELSSLDIPEATTEKLKLMEANRCPSALSFRRSEYALVVPAIERWIRQPSHAVNRPEIEVLATSRTINNPELADLDNPDKDYGSFWAGTINTAYSAVAHDVCTLPRKTAAAQKSTNETVCNSFPAGLVSDESWKGTHCSCPAKPKIR